MIKRMALGKIIFESDGKTMTIYGEALDSSVNGFDYVIYADTIDKWDPLFENFSMH